MLRESGWVVTVDAGTRDAHLTRELLFHLARRAGGHGAQGGDALFGGGCRLCTPPRLKGGALHFSVLNPSTGLVYL